MKENYIYINLTQNKGGKKSGRMVLGFNFPLIYVSTIYKVIK